MILGAMTDGKTWEKRVAAWRASGDSATEFAARGGYAASTLRNWASRLARRRKGLVRVVREERLVPTHAAAPIEIRVGEARVIVLAGFDAGTLRAVLEVLRAGS